MEDMQYIVANRSHNFLSNNNLPTHYGPSLRNHKNLSYSGQQGQRVHQQLYKNHYAPPGFHGDGQGATSSNSRGADEVGSILGAGTVA